MSKVGMGLSLLAARLTGRRFPCMVNWAVTGRCNLRCRHCYGDYGAAQKAELPLDLLLRTVDELQAMGTRRITLEGGEPLVRPDIVRLVDHIRSRRIEIALCTNGILLPGLLDELAGKIDLFVLSLDGSEPYNDWLRGKGAYRKTLAALEALRERGIRPLIFSCLIDRNMDDIDAVVRVAREVGAYVTFNIAVARIGDQNGRVPLQKEQDAAYRRAIAHIVRLKRQGAPVYYSLGNYRQALSWPTFAVESYRREDLPAMARAARRRMIPCLAGRYWCYIECNGEVYPCYQVVGTLAAKNIREHGVRQAFEHLASLSTCCRCYNLTLSELNLQAGLDPRAVLRVVRNYFFTKRAGRSS
ncbi:MAG: radical SAM protein [Kiritimatiellae bacterium]|nr:radical SAM protein [Kiritimatiellia bacterium]